MSELCAMVHVALHRLIKIRATLLDLFFFATFASFYMHNICTKYILLYLYVYIYIYNYIYDIISMLLEFGICYFELCGVHRLLLNC